MPWGAIYLHTDHLGSTRLTTLGDGTDRYSQEYHAFGAKRGGGLLTSFRFTGQREEMGSGLVYMHARYYDPTTGQFISPDSIVPEPGRIVAYNRYLYAYADPLTYSDPSGHASSAAAEDWSWKNRWYNAHGYFWNGATGHWSDQGPPVFTDDQILNDAMAEAGIGWQAEAGLTWTGARKAKVAGGVMRLGQVLSGGLGALRSLLGGGATMLLMAGTSLHCFGGEAACTLPGWGAVVAWPVGLIDNGSADYVGATAVHELAHLMDYESGGVYSHNWWPQIPLSNYANCWACVWHWEKWAEAVAIAVYGPAYLDDIRQDRYRRADERVVALQIDMVHSILNSGPYPAIKGFYPVPIP